MSRLPTLSGDDFVKAMVRIGYRLDRIRGSHMVIKHPARRSLSVPRHRELGRGVLRRLMRDAGVSREEVARLIK